ncbi:MAG: DNA-directed RNA polymerase I subunit rpa49 [Vezdaea acicularis]|nr:MAG: DNA-directed RNA polymerase I subunit rpa49 [Vezdaea acicularis]
MSDGKRKRDSDHSDRPLKKAAVNRVHQPLARNGSIKVSMVENTDDWCPIIVTAPGMIVPTHPFKPYSKTRMDSTFNPRKKSPIQSSELLLQSSEHPKIDYVAREESVGAHSLRRHYVGIYDPETGKVEVIEARNLVLRGTVRELPEEASKDDILMETSQSLKNDLGRTFGTKKARKAIDSLTVNAISLQKPDGPKDPDRHTPPPDARTSAIIESLTHSTSSMPTRQELQLAVDEKKPRPKANLDTEVPEEVYPIEELVGGTDIMLQIPVHHWQEAARQNKLITMKSRHVNKRLAKVLQGGNGDVRKLRALRYLLILLDFHLSLKPGKFGGKKAGMTKDLASQLGISEALADKVKVRFTEEGSNFLNKWHLDNLWTHIAALALVVDDFEVDTYELKEDLRMETKEMSKYFQEIGCKVTIPTDSERRRFGIATKVEAQMHRIARLKLPLEFPKLRVPAGNYRKR